MSNSRAAMMISPFFFPENISTGRYNTYLAHALSEADCDVSVVCSHPFYPEWSVEEATDDTSGEITILRGGLWVRYPRKQVLRRLLLELWFSVHVVRTLRRLRKCSLALRIDVYPPNIFALAASLVCRNGPPVFAIVHDLQGIMSGGSKSSLRRIVSGLIRPIEGLVLRRADRLVFLSSAMLDFAVRNYGVKRSRAMVAYPFSTLKLDALANAITPEVMSGAKKTLVYSGALGEKQNPAGLFELMDAFARKRPDFDVHVFSDGPIFNQLKERGRELGSAVAFHGLVGSHELPGLLKASTVQIIPQHPGLSDGAFPSKLPNLIATNTAVFAITDEGSEVGAILDEYERGMAIYTWDAGTALRALERFADSMDSEPAGLHARDHEIMRRFDVNSLRDTILDYAHIGKGVTGA